MSDREQELECVITDLTKQVQEAHAENARLREAMGLITTLAPTMEINPDDPIGMARNIVAEVSDKMARLRGGLK